MILPMDDGYNNRKNSSWKKITSNTVGFYRNKVSFIISFLFTDLQNYYIIKYFKFKKKNLEEKGNNFHHRKSVTLINLN